MPIIYLHGFASSPNSRKADYFREQWAAEGRTVHVPDLNAGGFSRLTISRMLGQAAELSARLAHPYVLMGSSLGAYAAALYAGRQDRHLRGLILMAPAFDFIRGFSASLGEETMRRWRETGAIPVMHLGLEREIPLAHVFVADGLKHPPFPAVRELPCLLLHGLRDDVVPVSVSRRFVEENPGVEAHYLDGGHDLLECLEELQRLTARFLDRLPPAAESKGG